MTTLREAVERRMITRAIEAALKEKNHDQP